MKRNSFFLALGTLFLTMGLAQAHCEIPCGIFDDHARFHKLDEHITTIQKAMASIRDLSKEKSDAQTTNQLVRWVTLKEDTSNAVQDMMAHYFLAQKIKSAYGKKVYVDLLEKAHAVIVGAMKTKQSVGQDTVDDLKKAVKAFEKVYKKAVKPKK